MGQAFTPGLQVKRLAKIARIRELPIPGEIKVSIGQRVKSSDVVAEAALPGELHILRIPEEMGVEAVDVVAKLSVKEGDRVTRGQIMCEHAGLFGLFKTRYASPVDGAVELITPKTGHVAVRLASNVLALDAYISGTVVDVANKKTVKIESDATFVQGIFGIGGERRGTIKMLDVECGGFIKPEHIPAEVQGKILIGGTSPTKEALFRASESGAVGFICGAIDDRALAAYLGYDLGIALTGDEKVPMSVIVTEGFGGIPFSAHVQKLLKECEGMQASINGATQVRAGALRPEIIIERQDLTSADSAKAAAPSQRGLSVGSKIRIIRVPYFGQYAKVVDLPHESAVLDTGAHARILKAELEDGKTVVVPRANVELI